MATKVLPARSLVRQLLRYDAKTGNLVWLPRPRELCASNGAFLDWNNRYPGKVAGYARPSTKGDKYLHIGIQGDIYKAHRLVWLYVHGEPVPEMIDHIDHDRLNNRIENLRSATMSQNRANSFVRSDNVLGLKGVTPTKQGRFVALICRNQKSFYLGTYDTAEAASEAYKAAAANLYGEFARWHQR